MSSVEKADMTEEQVRAEESAPGRGRVCPQVQEAFHLGGRNL